MKILMIALVVGLLAVAGFAFASSLQVEKTEVSASVDKLPSCDGSCGCGKNCANANCGMKTGGNCGCKK